MSELISGKDALIAKLNGKDVQYNLGGLEWSDLTDRELNYWQGERYVNEELGYKFRLKPQTIKINGIEVPKPFKPKEGEWFYYVTSETDNYGGWCGTSFKNVNSDDFKNVTRLGAWRTKEEIEQVVKALRSVFNG